MSSPDSLQAYLTTAMTIIIGVEFVKMIFSYNINTVIEVLLLAVARQMVVTHTSPLENLITILSVTLLFAIRKFLYVPSARPRYARGGRPAAPLLRRAARAEAGRAQATEPRKEESDNYAAQ